MPSSSLLESRIIDLLTTTDLTFKEIIVRLEAEHLSASIGVIRRINRDNRYRQPRYDSKLTPTQREALVQELLECANRKPNLSLLAKRYGVCHGSVWYWWDKLNRLKAPGGGGGAGGQLKARKSPPSDSESSGYRRHSPYQLAFSSGCWPTKRPTTVATTVVATTTPTTTTCDRSLDAAYSTIGRVSVLVGRDGPSIALPILMFARKHHEQQQRLVLAS